MFYVEIKREKPTLFPCLFQTFQIKNTFYVTFTRQNNLNAPDNLLKNPKYYKSSLEKNESLSNANEIPYINYFHYMFVFLIKELSRLE